MKIVFILIFIVSLISEIPAQFKYGIEVGLNISNLKGNDPTINKGTSGIVTGLNGQYELLDYFSIGSGLYLSQKGVVRTLFSSVQGIETYDYIEVPFNLFFTLPIKQSGKTAVFAGAYIARLLYASVTPDNQGLTADLNLDDIMRHSDYGLNFGIRQGFNLSSGMVNLGIKYSLGLVSLDVPYTVIKYGETYSSDGSRKLTNSVVSFTVGYTF